MSQKVELSAMRQRIAELVAAKPEKAARILTLWLKEAAKKRSLPKKAG